MQVIVDGLLVNYTRQGSGKKIVLLPGWANTTTDLKELSSGLARDFDVTSVDLPGFGGSQAPTRAWGLDDYAVFLASFLNKIGLKDLYCLAGHSNGGALAIKAVADDHIQPERLVLLSASGIRGNGKGRLGAIKIVTKAGKLVTRPLPLSTRKKLRGKLYAQVGSDLLAAEHMSDTFKKIVNEDLRASAAKLSVPTLLIYGEEDRETPVTYGRLYHELIDGSTLEIVAHAGHNIQKDESQAVVKLIRDFLC